MPRKLVTVDFETWPIRQRPHYPPQPVGVSIKERGQPPIYAAFGHMSGGNNCDEHHARTLLAQYWLDPDYEILFHHAKFDCAVAVERWGLPMLPWDRIHDTLFLSFLYDPYFSHFGLKTLADVVLHMPPDERDDVAGWIMENKSELERLYSAQLGGMKVQKKKAGAWIFAVPGDNVAPYANGDTIRTEALFDHLYEVIVGEGMLPAYNRERRLMPILMENERVGMRADVAALERDVEQYGRAFDYVEDQLRFALRASGLNFDADADVAAVLIERGIVLEEDFVRTAPTKTNPNGVLSMSKDNLLPEMFTGTTAQGVPGHQIASALGYRNRLKTCLDMFMRPWLAQAVEYGGYITTNWNQIRGEGGTRTGRPSTNEHNFLNISKDFSGRDDQYVHPDFLGVPELPLCRRYVLPDEGHVFLHRDFSGQELRVFGHFEQGALWEQYQQNPALDVHAFVGAEFMQAAGREIERTKIKVMNFQRIYGGGGPALAAKLRISLAEAKRLLAFHDQALPGRKILNEEITRVIRRGDPIRTWGGRLYFAESNDKIYKLLNYLVQGSAADLTKQAILDWHDANESLPADQQSRFLVTVYDEINLSSPKPFARENMALLKLEMEKPRLSVPMLSDGKWGAAWGKLEKYKDE